MLQVPPAFPPGFDRADVSFHRIALTAAEQVPRKICSVFPLPMNISYVGRGSQTIPAGRGLESKTIEDLGVCEVAPGVDAIDTGVMKMNIVCTPAAVVAMDMLEMPPGSYDPATNVPKNAEEVPFEQEGSAKWRMGMFVPAGLEPTSLEISAAVGRFRRWCEMQVRFADEQWLSDKSVLSIPTSAILAARTLGQSREWVTSQSEVRGRIPCPACREDIVEGAVICKHCHSAIEYGKNGVATLKGK